MNMGINVNMKTIKTVTAIIRAIKTGDERKINSILRDAPDEVREKINKIIGVYREAMAGRIDKETAARAIIREISPGSDVDDIIELIMSLA